ncbi:cyclophilin-like fold protein [Rhodococcus erythropolis]
MRIGKKAVTAAAGLAAAIILASCDASPEENLATSASPSPSESSDTAAPSAPKISTEDSVEGTTVHFAAGDVIVSVVVDEDNPTTRSFLAMLPMTMEFADFGGKEKVATPTANWDFTDAEGLNPQVGDLFSYMPWGNLGFFYNVEGNTFSNDLTKIGETEDVDQIERLDGQQVTISVAG